MNYNDLRELAYKKNEQKEEPVFKKVNALLKQTDKGLVVDISNPNNLEINKDYAKPGFEKTITKDSVFRRVAKFLMIIGEEEAAKILPHLSDAQIEKIIPEIANIKKVDKDEAQIILDEFSSLLNQSRESGGINTARQMLEKTYGKEKAQRMLSKAVPLEGRIPFEYFKDADKEKIFTLINDESIAVQAIILSHLEAKKAASVINLMQAEQKKEVVLRLAKMQGVEPDVIRRIDDSMHKKSLHYSVEKTEQLDGKNTLAQILKKMDVSKEGDVLNLLAKDDPELAQDLRSRLFTQEDVINADNKYIQKLLHDWEDKSICLLIATKTDEFRNKILDNVSQNRKTEILTQEEILKPFRKSDCEQVTSMFFSILRRAWEEGKLIISTRDEDIYV